MIGASVKKLRGPTSDAHVQKIFAGLAATITPRCELEHKSVFELLVAVVLSAQCTDINVNKATVKLFPVANTPQAILALGVAGLTPYIRSIGLFNAKAKNVVGLSQLLIERHGGEVPRDHAALCALPGVGRKTANVVMNVWWGEPTIAVDTHAHRLANRMGISRSKTPEQTELVLLARVPDEFRRHAHSYLVLHGRYSCTARSPRCDACPVAKWCPKIGVS
ncbi:MAG: endonuclease III [Planctomycetota bacterium]|mgnify:FL=1